MYCHGCIYTKSLKISFSQNDQLHLNLPFLLEVPMAPTLTPTVIVTVTVTVTIIDYYYYYYYYYYYDCHWKSSKDPAVLEATTFIWKYGQQLLYGRHFLPLFVVTFTTSRLARAIATVAMDLTVTVGSWG